MTAFEALPPVSLPGLGARVLRRRRARGRRAVTALSGLSPASVPDARRFVSNVATRWEIPRTQALDLVLIVSELATNAVEHAPALRMTVTVALVPGAVKVSVTDRGTSPHTLAVKEASNLAEGGRGLALVDDLAECWGYTILNPGARVWARVMIPAGCPVQRSATGGGAA